MLKIVGLSVLASSGLLLAAGHAEAKGCNGVVNQFEWGCAAWDNNNGPQYPHYKAPPKPAPAHQAGPPPVVVPPKAQPPKVAIQPAKPSSGTPAIAGGSKMISSDSAGVVGPAAGSLLSPNGGNVRH